MRARSSRSWSRTASRGVRPAALPRQDRLMFRRVLVANRGEIAQRIIRACRELGVETVAVYSEADADALYLRQADETICIGPAPAATAPTSTSRRSSPRRRSPTWRRSRRATAFLAENAHFAEVCRSCNIQFIGPDPETIAALGDKANAPRDGDARRRAGRARLGRAGRGRERGARHRPGDRLPGDDQGLGRGRRARHAHREQRPEPRQRAPRGARRGRGAAFGTTTVYLEKFVENPRHVEMQILGDRDGNVVHLGERDCSVQRRHQKLVEESPSPST